MNHLELTPIVVSIIALITSVSAPIILKLVEYYLKKKELRAEKLFDIVGQSIQEHLDIDNRLSQLLEAVDADRVSIYMFHNGEKFFETSMHIKFMSKAFEQRQYGIASELENSQRIPIQIYMPAICKVKDDGMFMLDDLSTAPLENFTLMLKNKGLKSVYYFKIENLAGKMVGILSLGYITKMKLLTQNNIVLCKITCDQLSGYLH